MPTNGHRIALLRMILNSNADRILCMTLSFSGAHIGDGAKGKIALLSVTLSQQGA